ncbi:MAG: hypothetical protein WCE73_06040 [Candidatus Angelobacter sp.]
MFRTLEIALLVTGGLLYVAAKAHFFLRYGSGDFVSEHWPLWAGMAAVGIVLTFLDWLKTHFAGNDNY